jgi:hypothetical protein
VLLWCHMFWPFRRKKRAKKALEKVVTGMIIGAAISSIVGKTILEKQRKKEAEENEDK